MSNLGGHLNRLASLASATAILTCLSCAHSPLPSSSRAKRNVLLFSNNRHLEVGQSGCSRELLGGIDLERAVLKQRASPGTGIIASGPSFIPYFTEFQPGSEDVYFRQALELVAYWNAVGLTALAISLEDMRLGVSRVRRLEEKARFRFLSTNIVSNDGTRLFDPFRVLALSNGRSVLVLAISHPGKVTVDNETVQAIDPRKAISEVMKMLPKRPDFIVLLASVLNEDAIREVAKQIYLPHIFLGGLEAEQNISPRSISSRGAWLNPLNRGRSIAEIDIGDIDRQPAIEVIAIKENP